MSEVNSTLLFALFRNVMFTEHFTAFELLYSANGDRHGLLNFPSDPLVFANLRKVALFLEEVRKRLDHPIRINSGYRSPEVNKLVGGVPDSYHLRGLAADICVGRLPVSYYVAAIESALKTWQFAKDYKITTIVGKSNSYIHIQLKPKSEQLRTIFRNYE